MQRERLVTQLIWQVLSSLSSFFLAVGLLFSSRSWKIFFPSFFFLLAGFLNIVSKYHRIIWENTGTGDGDKSVGGHIFLSKLDFILKSDFNGNQSSYQPWSNRGSVRKTFAPNMCTSTHCVMNTPEYMPTHKMLNFTMFMSNELANASQFLGLVSNYAIGELCTLPFHCYSVNHCSYRKVQV